MTTIEEYEAIIKILFTLHSSPFDREPLCLSAFRRVKSSFHLFTHSSPLFTTLFWRIFKPLRELAQDTPEGEEW